MAPFNNTGPFIIHRREGGGGLVEFCLSCFYLSYSIIMKKNNNCYRLIILY